MAKKQKTIRESFLSKDNLARDIVILIMSIGLAILLIINHRQLSYKKNQLSEQIQPESEVITEQTVMVENEAESPVVDTTNWKTYQTQWYGFEINYPEDWAKPVLKSAVKAATWEYRYQFRKAITDKNNPYIGFDVVVYNVNKIKELPNTDEFPKIKNEDLKTWGACQEIEGHLVENEEYPAEQIYISSDDNCYNPAYFYTLTRDNYIYNIVPVLTGEEEKTIQNEKEIIQNIPEFISASSTFNLINIKRPKPVPAKPKITAPKPVGATKRNAQGRRVCARKNDHPGKIKQNKKKHLDMECCLDPDEYPNPHCYYPKDKYGKYL